MPNGNTRGTLHSSCTTASGSRPRSSSSVFMKTTLTLNPVRLKTPSVCACAVEHVHPLMYSSSRYARFLRFTGYISRRRRSCGWRLCRRPWEGLLRFPLHLLSPEGFKPFSAFRAFEQPNVAKERNNIRPGASTTY